MPVRKNKYFVFALKGKRFAMPLEYVEAVHALPEIVTIPGNRSRVFLGLAYILGKLVSVADVGPLVNLGTTSGRSEGLILHSAGQYYAIPIDSAGGIVHAPMVRLKRASPSIASGSLKQKEGFISVIEVQKLIEHICS